MIRSGLWGYSDTYLLVKETITVPSTGIAAALDNRNNKLIFINCAPFTDCISKIDNKKIDHVKDTDVLMPIYNFLEYCDNHLKTCASLQQYDNDEPFINNGGVFTDIPDGPDCVSFKYKQEITD